MTMSNQNIDYTIPLPPKEPISCLAFNPNPSKAHQLLVSSWDKTVRLYHLPNLDEASTSDPSKTVRCIHTFTHEAPVLDICWITDTLAASGGIDRRVRLLNLETGQTNIIGKHSAAISRIRYSHSTNLLFTSSWDSTLKVWDPSPMNASLLRTIDLPDKALAMDVSPPYPIAEKSINIIEDTPRLVIGMAGRLIHIFNLSRWREEVENGEIDRQNDESVWRAEQKRESSLKFMLRDIRCMPDGQGYVISSIEGRIAVEFFDSSEAVQAKKYAFKCHRQMIDGVDTVYPVNGISFHPQHATFVSLGGDAIVAIWDPVAKKRIRQYPRFPSPLSTGALSSDGIWLAVASGFENIEDTRHHGPAPGEVGGIGTGGEGKVQIHIRSVWEDCKPKAK